MSSSDSKAYGWEPQRSPRCQNWFEVDFFSHKEHVRCSLANGHGGDHQAEFPRYHCHVDAAGRETPEVEQPFCWDAALGKIWNAQ